MELDGRRYPEIDDAVYRLSQELYQANTSEVDASPLGDHNQSLPGKLRPQVLLP